MLLGTIATQADTSVGAIQAARPNIVLIFPDNLGWGEIGAYGGVRGPFTPRIDKLAAEGIRLNNFNVEYSCTVSRAALLRERPIIHASVRGVRVASAAAVSARLFVRDARGHARPQVNLGGRTLGCAANTQQ